MTKLKLALILCAFISSLNAQNVGINATGAAPNSSAGLDVNFTDKGVLIPRVALTALNSASPISSPTVSLLVYNTATAGSAPNNVTPGYYYWDGTKWVTIFSSASSGRYLGELYGGGVIFYLWKDAGVEHGLIASLAHLDGGSGVEWISDCSDPALNSLPNSYLDGQVNTAAIVAVDPTPGYAATLCDAYSGGGYTDWYLPAPVELSALFDAAVLLRSITGVTALEEIYWTSWGDSYAAKIRSVYRIDGTALSCGGSVFRVRAIRKF